MNPESGLKPSKALNGVHGVHLVSHLPFSFQEINQNGDFSEPTSEASSVWHRRPDCLRPIRCCQNGILKYVHLTKY